MKKAVILMAGAAILAVIGNILSEASFVAVGLGLFVMSVAERVDFEGGVGE